MTIELTGRQKRFLRSMGQTLDPAVLVGKSGVTDALLREVDLRLSQREVIKIRLEETLTGGARKAQAEQIAEGVGAVCAGVTGRTCLLYRPGESLAEEETITLPPPGHK